MRRYRRARGNNTEGLTSSLRLVLRQKAAPIAGRDNVFVERLWRSVKYEEVYLRAYETVAEARSSIGRYLDFYNGRRPHSSLDDRTPDQAYFDLPPLRAAA